MEIANRGQILLLNGVSSAGKTTLGHAIQELMEEPYYLMGNDLFFDMLPQKFCDADWREAEYQALRLMAKTAALFSDCGKPVILDSVLVTNQKGDPYAEIRKALAGYPLYQILVCCPAEELARREIQRGDRNIGQAVGQLETLYPKDGYDLSVDTFAEDTEACARKIAAYISAHPRA